jgi:hypothetical protein
VLGGEGLAADCRGRWQAKDALKRAQAASWIAAERHGQSIPRWRTLFEPERSIPFALQKSARRKFHF